MGTEMRTVNTEWLHLEIADDSGGVLYTLEDLQFAVNWRGEIEAIITETRERKVGITNVTENSLSKGPIFDALCALAYDRWPDEISEAAAACYPTRRSEGYSENRLSPADVGVGRP